MLQQEPPSLVVSGGRLCGVIEFSHHIIIIAMQLARTSYILDFLAGQSILQHGSCKTIGELFLPRLGTRTLRVPFGKTTF